MCRSKVYLEDGMVCYLASLWAVTPLSIFFVVLSIQPKHMASSTESMYQKVPSSTGRPRFTITQHSFSLSWLFMSHSLSSLRFFASSRFVNSIIISPKFRSGKLDYTISTGIIPQADVSRKMSFVPSLLFTAGFSHDV